MASNDVFSSFFSALLPPLPLPLSASRVSPHQVASIRFPSRLTPFSLLQPLILEYTIISIPLSMAPPRIFIPHPASINRPPIMCFPRILMSGFYLRHHALASARFHLLNDETEVSRYFFPTGVRISAHEAHVSHSHTHPIRDAPPCASSYSCGFWGRSPLRPAADIFVPIWRSAIPNMPSRFSSRSSLRFFTPHLGATIPRTVIYITPLSRPLGFLLPLGETSFHRLGSFIVALVRTLCIYTHTCVHDFHTRRPSSNHTLFRQVKPR